MRRTTPSIGLALVLSTTVLAASQVAMAQESQPGVSTADTLYCEELLISAEK